MSKIQNMWQKVVNKLSDEEIVVANATSTKVAWGPTTEEMDEIIQLSRGPAQHKVLQFMFTQLTDSHADWRVVYKTLLLIEYMSLHADMGVVDYFKRNIQDVRRLQGYQFRDKDGADKGINVRKRAETVADELEDVDLPEKREQAQEQKSKYAEAVGSGFSGSYGGNTGSYEGPSSQGSYENSREDFKEDNQSSLGQFAQVAPEVEQYPEEQPVQPQFQEPTQYEPQSEYNEVPIQEAQPEQVQQFQQAPVEPFQQQPQQFEEQPQPFEQPPQYQAQRPAFPPPPQGIQTAPVTEFNAPPAQEQQFEQPVQQFEEPIEQAPVSQEQDLLADIFGAPAPQKQQEAGFAQPTFEPVSEETFSPVTQQPEFMPPAEQAEFQPAPAANKKKDNLASLLDF